jgi:hypothetical protein
MVARRAVEARVPVPANPSLPEFYVYRLEANGVPFYVGIGRSARARGRVGFVRYLMAREAKGKTAKWNIHTRAMAALLIGGCSIHVVYVATDLTRADALLAEPKEIARLVDEGFALANIQHNPKRPKTPEEVTRAVFERLGQNPPVDAQGSLRMGPTSSHVSGGGDSRMAAEAPMPKRLYRTPEQLREASKHLAYEVWMFESTCRALEAGGQPDAVRCALLESFAIHTRILLDVFYRTTSSYPDDMLAADFFPDATGWSKTQEDIPEPLRDAQGRANKEIAHLSYERLDRRPDDWHWNITLMRNAMSVVVAEFCRTVPPAHLDETAWQRSPDVPIATPASLPATSQTPIDVTSANSITVAPLVSMPPSQKEE